MEQEKLSQNAPSMFDPYHKWLGIPPKDQPPNHYRVLGIDLFGSDPEVIDAAANRQMAYLQQRATGGHAALSQKLLNEVAAARLCLFDPDKCQSALVSPKGSSRQFRFSSCENVPMIHFPSKHADTGSDGDTGYL
jgi:hypothetical protein